MNVPYPPFLGAKRDIDLIIAPDFSAGEVFEVQLNAFKLKAVVWSKTSPLALVICAAALFFPIPISPSDNPQTQSGFPCAPRGEIELPFIPYKHHVLLFLLSDPDSCKEICTGQREAFSKDRWPNQEGERLAQRLLRVWGEEDGANHHLHAALQQSQLQRFVSLPSIWQFCFVAVGLIPWTVFPLNVSLIVLYFWLLCVQASKQGDFTLHIQKTKRFLTVSYRCRRFAGKGEGVLHLPTALQQWHDEQVVGHREGQHQEEQDNHGARDGKGHSAQKPPQLQIDQSGNVTRGKHVSRTDGCNWDLILTNFFIFSFRCSKSYLFGINRNFLFNHHYTQIKNRYRCCQMNLKINKIY